MTGKIIGGVLGALLGGPWGAVIGATAGHFVVDRRKNSFNKVAFFEYLCMVIAKVAKIIEKTKCFLIKIQSCLQINTFLGK